MHKINTIWYVLWALVTVLWYFSVEHLFLNLNTPMNPSMKVILFGNIQAENEKQKKQQQQILNIKWHL